MKRSFAGKVVIPAAIAMLGASTAPAHAYLDPGTGSMLLQLLLGGIAGAAIVIKLYWYRLISLFGLGPKDEAPKATDKARRGDAEADA